MDLVELLERDRPGLDVHQPYLERLKTLPQSLIPNEMSHLEDGLQAIQKAVESLGASHHEDFVAAASGLDELTGLIGELESLAEQTREKSHKVLLPPHRAYTSTEHVLAIELALYHQIDKIQEILELPQLAQSCVSQGHYSAALDIVAFAGRLKTRFPDIKSITTLVDEVDKSTGAMLNILIRLLTETSHLPALIKAVGFLRRIDPFKSAKNATKQLQYVFLAARKEYLFTQWSTLDAVKSTPHLYLKRYVEMFREHVFATITSFSAVFGQTTLQVSEFVRDIVMIHMASTLEDMAPALSSTDRSSLWLQLAYCSHSFGRVGAEFWPLLKTAAPVDEWKQAFTNQQEMARTAAKTSGSR
ncbi:Conserved oligomeric Golgi complex subunit 8 [Wickerhamiella sorbophila]|uniref:Conserved oligomeric Golgi complex subunit 8 n=1 Tax=Wickerhamiella sorbophila TaxID=45607 RepID=A0A2T0FNZ4_9ASCO|nr:Conserved oligomeric Golgi complex subunit 8 [Wickerhamiella sorbophila]PRT56679.1 Conserved oligomeric Golgi complex subunit 8 [Wickerhamiella sorbophila]